MNFTELQKMINENMTDKKLTKVLDYVQSLNIQGDDKIKKAIKKQFKDIKDQDIDIVITLLSQFKFSML